MHPSLPLATLALLVACGDPSEHYRPPVDPGGAPGQGAAPPSAGDGHGQPPNQGPADGDGGGGTMAVPGGPCQATGLTNERYELEAGEGVTIEGDLLYAGEASGLVLVDTVGTNNLGSAEQAAYSVVCGGVGSFEAELPKDLGKVRLVVFIDTDGNGPSEGDPAGLSDEFTVGDDAVDGITVHLTDDPDLGSFAPGNQVAAPPARHDEDNPDGPAGPGAEGGEGGEPAAGPESEPAAAPGPAGEPSPGGGPVDGPAPAAPAAAPEGAPTPPPAEDPTER
jgi:hypothetical protein